MRTALAVSGPPDRAASDAALSGAPRRTRGARTADLVPGAAAADASLPDGTAPGGGATGGPQAGRRPRVTLPAELPPRPGGEAAVLCALYDDVVGEGPAEAHVVLTRRSRHLRSHTGEVSFPGGRLDPGETALAAALREAEEEISLDPTSVELVGQLSPLATVTSASAIVAFVGVLAEPPPLRANPAEVEGILRVPLSELWVPDVYHQELWPVGDGWIAVHFFDLIGDTVWGATARMLVDLLDRLWVASPG